MTPQELNGGNGPCGMNEFDSYRSKNLSKKLWQFNDKITGGIGNPSKTDITRFGTDDSMEAVQSRQNIINRFALSGGASPEEYEPACMFPCGTMRRTSTGQYQVGWDWDTNSNCPPKKKWFSVGYKFCEVKSPFSVPNCNYGIPMACPPYRRFDYVSPYLATNNCPQKPELNNDASASFKPVSGGLVGGPFGFKQSKSTTALSGGELTFYTDPKDMCKAIKQANCLRVPVNNGCLKRIHESVGSCACSMNRWLFVPSSRKICTELIPIFAEVKECEKQSTSNDQDFLKQLVYIKACINVCMLKSGCSKDLTNQIVAYLQSGNKANP